MGKLPSFNIFGLDIIELSLLYNIAYRLISEEEIEELEDYLSDKNNEE